MAQLTRWLPIVTVVGVAASVFFGWDAYRHRRRSEKSEEPGFRLQIREPGAPGDLYLDGVIWQDLIPPPVELEWEWDLRPSLPAI